MPLINYLWVGKPRYNTTGQDIMGPVLMAQAIENTENRICFWCPKEYENEYKNIFKTYKNIDVRNYEDYFAEKSQKSKKVSRVAEIYHELNRADTVQAFITAKDLLALMIESKEGGYVLDTNIIPIDDNVNFPKLGKFTCPLVIEENYDAGYRNTVYEAWGKAAKKNDQTAKFLFKNYLHHWDTLQNEFADVQNKYDNEDYYKRCGALITGLLDKNRNKLNTWGTDHLDGSANIPELNVAKLYYNTHKYENKNKKQSDFAFEALLICAQNQRYSNVFKYILKQVKVNIAMETFDNDTMLDWLYEFRDEAESTSDTNKLLDILIMSDNPFLDKLLETSKKESIAGILKLRIEKDEIQEKDFVFFERIVKTANVDISSLDEDQNSILDSILINYSSKPENLNRFLDILISSKNKSLNSITETSNKAGNMTCLHKYIAKIKEEELDKNIISKFIKLGVSIDIEANIKTLFDEPIPKWVAFNNMEKVTILDMLKAKKASGDKSAEECLDMIQEMNLNNGNNKINPLIENSIFNQTNIINKPDNPDQNDKKTCCCLIQ